MLEGFSDRPQNSVLRSEFDGYTKQRNRFTATLSNVTERYYMTSQQFSTFKDFYFNTLGNGADEFSKNDPVEGVNRIYRFVSPYEEQVVGLDWIVTLSLEKIT